MAVSLHELSVLFGEAGRAHHEAFAETDGDDDEWPLWYADYLALRLEPILGTRLTKSEVVYALVAASRLKPHANAPDSWEHRYAQHFIEAYGGK